MKIKLQDKFLKKLNRQVAYIAWDKPQAARKFKNDLLNRIKELKNNPYASRKPIYFDSDQIRDLIFKGYTIVYHVNENDQTITIFGFVRSESIL